MSPSNSIKALVERYRADTYIAKLKHQKIALILSILSLILFYYYAFKLTPSSTASSIALGLATTFFTAATVDVLYNWTFLKDIEKIIAGQLMLNEEVQRESLKDDKRLKILECALEFKLGNDLKKPVISLINSLDGYKNSGTYTIVLRKINSGSQYLRENFYNLELLVEFEDIVSSDKIAIIATDDEKIYTKESREDIGNKYIYFLPDFLDQLGKDFSFKTNVKIDNIDLEKIDEIDNIDLKKIDEPLKKDEIPEIDNGKRFIKHKFQRSDNSRKQVHIEYNINTILSKKEHLFFCDFNKAYKEFFIDFDCRDTDIERCEPYLPFSDPHIKYWGDDGRRIQVSIFDWILPPSIVCFVWY